MGAEEVKIGTLKSFSAKDSVLVSKRNVISNIIIRSDGWVFPYAVGVAVFHVSDSQVTHNEIADLRLQGDFRGLAMGLLPQPCEKNKIKFIHIHHMGRGDLSDMGGVYTLGASTGAEVSNKVVHLVYSMAYGRWGPYIDNDRLSTGQPARLLTLVPVCQRFFCRKHLP